MRNIVCTLTVAVAICARVHAQTPQFEVASIKAAQASFGGRFHASDAITGGPGTSDPGMFRCTCTVAALILKAFDLQSYQFPAPSSLPTDIYDVSAKVPAGTTNEQFSLMLQNLLKERFGLAWHFDKKEMQGYQLVLAKNGPKLKESQDEATKPAESHGGYAGHSGSGTFAFGGMGRYRGDHKTAEDLARALSNQILKPVEDQTGLTGEYDISLSWSSDTTPHNHQETGGGGHGDHGDGAPASPGDGPTLFDALQSQLGLKLVPSKKAAARILIVDHIEKAPVAN